ncbi:MAG: hypothetical protein IT204_05710 [Fimbriimonadaceae bacterium]|nr:hypothetical protein [Fimbriimonadaceae bacterium]
MRRPPLRVLLRQPTFLVGLLCDSLGVILIVSGASRQASGGSNALLLGGVGLLVAASGMLGLALRAAQPRPPDDSSDVTRGAIY